MSKRIRLLLVTCVCTAAFGLVAVGSALAATPAIATGTAVKVSSTSEVVYGAIAPAGFSVSYYFQYGPTATYGKNTVEVTLPVSSTNTEVDAVLTGLTPNTTYHYRLVAAADSNKTTVKPYYYEAALAGADAMFTTPAATTTTKTTSTVSLSSTTAKVKSKKASVVLSCKGNTACKGTLTLDKKVKVTVTVKKKKKTETKTEKLGSAKYSIAAGKKGTVTIKLSKLANTLLAAKGHKVSATATAAANKGLKGFKNKSITLKG